MLNQHLFVKRVYEFYESSEIQVGDPEEGVWCDAHYPAPKGEGEETLPLLWNHHQTQGILQSEEYDRCCFYPADARKFLTEGEFVDGWFDLWDIYEKWSSALGKEAAAKSHQEKTEDGKSVQAINSHRRKDDKGRSLTAVSNMEKMHREKDELGRSIQGVKNAKRLHKERDELGRSINAVRGANTVNSEKDELGKSANAVKGGKKAHLEKDSLGKSVHGLKSAERVNSQVWESTVDGFRGKPGGVAWHNKSNGWDPNARVRIE
jgi:hypothetical protein